jgi:soluble lytic murein transglycosylase-like protein
MFIRALIVGVVATVATPVVADAQIYAWRDANGTLILSDRKLSDGAMTYVVPEASNIRVATSRTLTPWEGRFESLVQEHASRQALRPDLVRAVIQVESGFNPMARSPRGAMGLMQLMPETARELGVRNPYDPADNIRGGCAYLRQLIDRYDGNEELALAAYNAGAGAVDRHGRTIPPYRETRDYVRKVTARGGEFAQAAPQKLVVYKTFEIIDGRAVPRYSTSKPISGSFEIVSH